MDDFTGNGSDDTGTDDTDTGTDTGEDTANADAGSDESGSQPKSEETIRRLQSERDKARADANKATAALEKVQRASAKGEAGTQVPPEVQEWIDAAKTNSKDALYKAHPRLESYGVSPDLITGDSPAEMRTSAESIDRFVTEMEGKIRNQVLEEHGFNPEPLTSPAEGRKSFSEMDEKEFNALVDNALRG